MKNVYLSKLFWETYSLTQSARSRFQVEFLHSDKFSHESLNDLSSQFWILNLKWIFRCCKEACSDSASGEIRHTPSSGVSYWVSFYLPLMGLFLRTNVFLTVACMWKGNIFKQKLSSQWFFDCRCILRWILGKRVEHLLIDYPKNIWLCELQLEDHYCRIYKNQRNENM